MNVHPSIESLILEIDAFRTRSGMSVTAFGLGALNDPHLISDLHRGRNLGIVTLDRIREFMREAA